MLSLSHRNKEKSTGNLTVDKNTETRQAKQKVSMQRKRKHVRFQQEMILTGQAKVYRLLTSENEGLQVLVSHTFYQQINSMSDFA